MSDKETNLFDGETIPAGVVDKILQEALAKNRITNRLVTEPYRCTVQTCQQWTTNVPYNGVCISCQSMDNTVSEPFWIVSRAMRWMQTPSDLLEVLMTSIALVPGEEGFEEKGPEPKHRTPEELIAIAQSPEGQDILAALWDTATRYCAHNMVSRQFQVENPRLPEGFEFRQQWVELPEEHKVYATRDRPKTRKERLAEKAAQEDFYAADKVRREEAARSAAIKTLERSLEEARKLGITPGDVL